MDLSERNTAIVIGDYEFNRKPFTERAIEPYKVIVVEDALKTFSLTKAIIVADLPGQFGLIRECCFKVFPYAEDYGLALVVIVHSDEEFIKVETIQKEYKNTSGAKIFLVSALSKAAEYIARHRIEPTPITATIIEGATAKLDNDDKLLLRRAFYDCKRIYLEEIIGGRGSMSVFRVHAWSLQSVAGPLPLPFFAKIAKPHEIIKEKSNYQEYAEHYIPFNLRPNIDYHRCVQTRSNAALIGNFVDDAGSLREALRLGHGIGSLFSLFETTLRNFRLQPFASGKKADADSLELFVKGQTRITDLISKPEIIQKAIEFGLSSKPEELHDQICATARSLPCITGPNHGDLHSGNVMVRAGDAILIDFASITTGPLTVDPATLETSLMFGTESHEKKGDFSEWSAFIDEIYEKKVTTLHPPALFEDKPGHFSWLRRSLRELRHILLACEGSDQEAKVVLAACLMRFSRQKIETLTNAEAIDLANNRHCYALVVAERIVKGFSASVKMGGEKS